MNPTNLKQEITYLATAVEIFRNQPDFTLTDELKPRKLQQGEKKHGAHIAKIVAERILKTSGENGTILLNAYKDETQRPWLAKSAKTLLQFFDYASSYSFLLGATHSICQKVAPAVMLLQQCGQVSPLETLLATLTLHTNTSSPHVEHMQAIKTELVALRHIRTYVECCKTLQAMTPFFQQLILEKLALEAMKRANVDFAKLYSFDNARKYPEFTSFDLIISNAPSTKEQALYDFHAALHIATFEWYKQDPLLDLNLLQANIQQVIHKQLSRTETLSEEYYALIEAHYLYTVAWRGYYQFPKEHLVPLTAAHIRLHTIASSFETSLYDRVKAEEMSATIAVQLLLFDKIACNCTRENDLNTYIESALYLLQVQDIQLDPSLLAISDNRLKARLMAFYLRYKILDHLDVDLLKKQLYQFLGSAGKQTYKKAQNLLKANPNQNAAVTKSLGTLETENFFKTFQAIITSFFPKAPSLSFIYKPPKWLVSKEKQEEFPTTSSTTITTIPHTQPEPTDVEEALPQPLPVQPVKMLPTLPIQYHPRVTRWSKRGIGVLQEDPQYKSLAENRWHEMVYRHNLPKQIDAYLKDLFVHLEWTTSRGKSNLFTAPATLLLNQTKIEGFIEYSFDTDLQTCYHRYFAPYQESLCHQIANQHFLLMTPPEIEPDLQGIWETNDPSISVIEETHQVTFIDKAHNARVVLHKNVK